MNKKNYIEPAQVAINMEPAVLMDMSMRKVDDHENDLGASSALSNKRGWSDDSSDDEGGYWE